jgi:hypothetical protein
MTVTVVAIAGFNIALNPVWTSSNRTGSDLRIEQA